MAKVFGNLQKTMMEPTYIGNAHAGYVNAKLAIISGPLNIAVASITLEVIIIEDIAGVWGYSNMHVAMVMCFLLKFSGSH